MLKPMIRPCVDGGTRAVECEEMGCDEYRVSRMPAMYEGRTARRRLKPACRAVAHRAGVCGYDLSRHDRGGEKKREGGIMPASRLRDVGECTRQLPENVSEGSLSAASANIECGEGRARNFSRLAPSVGSPENVNGPAGQKPVRRAVSHHAGARGTSFACPGSTWT